MVTGCVLGRRRSKKAGVGGSGEKKVIKIETDPSAHVCHENALGHYSDISFFT